MLLLVNKHRREGFRRNGRRRMCYEEKVEEKRDRKQCESGWTPSFGRVVERRLRRT